MIGRIIKEGLLEAKLECKARKIMKRSIKESINEVMQQRLDPFYGTRGVFLTQVGVAQYFKHVITVCPYDHEYRRNEYRPNRHEIANFALEKCRDQRYGLEYFVIRYGKTSDPAIGANPIAVAKNEEEIKNKLYEIVRKTIETVAREVNLFIRDDDLPAIVASIKPHDPYEHK